MKKPYLLIALALAGVLALPLVGQAVFSADTSDASRLSLIAPAAGLETPDVPSASPVSRNIIPAGTTSDEVITSRPSLGLNTASLDAVELPPLRIGLDKPEVITLDRDAINVMVGSDKNLRVVPDTNRTLVLIPKQPGSTYFKALDAEGKVIMQRHVIVGSPQTNYIRIRRACAGDDRSCQQYSVYHCPDMCHEVSVTQAGSAASSAVPQDAPQYRPRRNGEDAGGAEGQTGESDTLEDGQ
jgi:Flp pilus assembly secretin CpaC